jgi:hypothetical protein
MKIKIISGGTSETTKVVTETGEEIERVISVFWSVSSEDNKSMAMIAIREVQAEITLDDHKVEEAITPPKTYSDLYEEKIRKIRENNND